MIEVTDSAILDAAEVVAKEREREDRGLEDPKVMVTNALLLVEYVDDEGEKHLCYKWLDQTTTWCAVGMAQSFLIVQQVEQHIARMEDNDD